MNYDQPYTEAIDEWERHHAEPCDAPDYGDGYTPEPLTEDEITAAQDARDEAELWAERWTL